MESDVGRNHRAAGSRRIVVIVAVALLLGGFALPLPSAAAPLSGGGDLPADTSTWGTVAVDGSAAGELTGYMDVDWYRVELVAGVSYRIDMLGGWSGEWKLVGGSVEFVAPGTLHDPELAGVYDSDGTLVPGSDDEVNGAGLDSRIESFVPAETGVHYIAAGSAGDSGTGTYELKVTAPVAVVEAVDPPAPAAEPAQVDETPTVPGVPDVNADEHLHLGMIKLSWDGVDGAASYEVRYMRHAEWIALPSDEHGFDAIFDGPSVIVDGLGNLAYYEFQVRAVNDIGASDWSRTHVFTPLAEIDFFINARPRLEGSRLRRPGSARA